MSYISITFLAFVCVMFLLYFLLPKRMQWVVLLIGSYVFYIAAGWKFVPFLVLTTVTVFLIGLWLGKTNDSYKADLAARKESLTREEKTVLKNRYIRKKRWILASGLILNFGVLAFLKYFNFFAENVTALFGKLHMDASVPQLELLLPLGISFYTFQAMGYLIDVYRGKYAPDRNLAKFALFVSFFPQIVQGPISRYDQLAHQLYAPHKFDYTRFKHGVELILWGYFKKLVIADRAAILTSYVLQNRADFAGLEIAVTVLVFMAQVYADFSGGMDISIGIAECCGIEMVQNFRRPHFAKSIAEYWRRWHITLGSWMKDYVLYPISLSKAFAKLGKKTRKWFGNYWGKQIPTCIAMGIVFLLVGIWHGASWKYIMFGVYNGGLIMLGILFSPLLENFNDKHKLVNTHTFSWGLFRLLTTFFLVFIGKYFALAEGFRAACSMLLSTFTTFNPWVLVDGSLYEMGLDANNFHLLILAIFVFFVVSLLQEKGYKLRESLDRQNIVFRWAVYLTAVYAVIIFGVYGIGFDAASFIYQGF